ncbi:MULTISPECIES: YpmS family protein [Bacillaceae]|uniref:YpmS family protein n=1 Tax=Evansella alkalicola TaxID=745819 RepID=A0ABS6JQA7_9BACI|nr:MULTISPECIES: YpmS family protein [Bacillaceae]MBU9720725.1 YpmS family protein [Bacillus alkalicola]
MKKRNGWKIAFIISHSIIAVMVITFCVWLSGISNYQTKEQPSSENQSIGGGAEFMVTTTKDQINKLITNELEKEGEQFQVYIDNYVHFEMDLNIFGFQVPLQMQFEPNVMSKGNVKLIKHSFTIGNFNLPSEKIFQVIATAADLPDWVIVYPEESAIYLDLFDGISEDFHILMEQFDLEEDVVKLTIITK